eukprot:scaffold27683_cov63-Phaeocystis_antarctica.AAC.2
MRAIPSHASKSASGRSASAVESDVLINWSDAFASSPDTEWIKECSEAALITRSASISRYVSPSPSPSPSSRYESPSPPSEMALDSRLCCEPERNPGEKACSPELWPEPGSVRVGVGVRAIRRVEARAGVRVRVKLPGSVSSGGTYSPKAEVPWINGLRCARGEPPRKKDHVALARARHAHNARAAAHTRTSSAASNGGSSAGVATSGGSTTHGTNGSGGSAAHASSSGAVTSAGHQRPASHASVTRAAEEARPPPGTSHPSGASHAEVMRRRGCSVGGAPRGSGAPAAASSADTARQVILTRRCSVGDSSGTTREPAGRCRSEEASGMVAVAPPSSWREMESRREMRCRLAESVLGTPLVG